MILLPHFTRSLLVRSALAWLFLRALVTAGSLAVEGAIGLAPGPLLRISPRAAILVVGIVAAVGWVYARRRNEDVFLRSLGYGPARLLGTVALPAALAELAIGVAVRW